LWNAGAALLEARTEEFATMAVFAHVPKERISPARARLLERVNRLLEGHDIDLIGTVAVNVMVDVILTEVTDGDLAKVDALVDDMAAALKTACRLCINRDRETMQ
jgi:hypothetical protein